MADDLTIDDVHGFVTGVWGLEAELKTLERDREAFDELNRRIVEELQPLFADWEEPNFGTFSWALLSPLRVPETDESYASWGDQAPPTPRETLKITKYTKRDRRFWFVYVTVHDPWKLRLNDAFVVEQRDSELKFIAGYYIKDELLTRYVGERLGSISKVGTVREVRRYIQVEPGTKGEEEFLRER